jgi:hypothetical protein
MKGENRIDRLSHHGRSVAGGSAQAPRRARTVHAASPDGEAMKHLISASRRTDFPRFYARWFSERRKAGWAEYRNSFGSSGRVSLLNRDVAGYLFWTRFARPFAQPLQALLDDGMPCVFQYTINAYGQVVPRSA